MKKRGSLSAVFLALSFTLSGCAGDPRPTNPGSGGQALSPGAPGENYRFQYHDRDCPKGVFVFPKLKDFCSFIQDRQENQDCDTSSRRNAFDANCAPVGITWDGPYACYFDVSPLASNTMVQPRRVCVDNRTGPVDNLSLSLGRTDRGEELTAQVQMLLKEPRSRRSKKAARGNIHILHRDRSGKVLHEMETQTGGWGTFNSNTGGDFGPFRLSLTCQSVTSCE